MQLAVVIGTSDSYWASVR